MRCIARGAAGRVMAGPDVAATLGAWSLAVDDGTMSAGAWCCDAQVRTRNAFLLAHAGRFGLRLDLGATEWRWDDVAVQHGQALTIRGAGKPEVR